MNPVDPRYSPETPKKELQLQGPRPPPLKVSKDSHKIRKPPPHPQLKPPPNSFRPQQQPPQQPVIIYAVSPKVIHATVSDFMSIVQRLTGPSSSSSRAGDLSPAARIASIEKTSPPERNRDRAGSAAAVMGIDPIVEGEGLVELGQAYPGILSPAPMTLPPIPDGFFSPSSDPLGFPPFPELTSPFWRNGLFTASPSGLLSAPLISPSPSSLDFLSNFFGF